MDISHFNIRKNSENGVFVALVDPFTKEPIGAGEDAPGFLVRGAASRTVQSRLSEMMAKPQSEAGDGDKKAVMEALHSTLIETAMSYVIAPVNIEIEGRKAETLEDCRAVLDYTFPEIGATKDADGNALTDIVKNEDGLDTVIPKMELQNYPFAKQVIDAAEESRRFLGKTAKA